MAAAEAVAGWGLPQGKGGRIAVGPDLRVQGQDRIFAVGDIAVNPDDPTPQLAQPALQMGRHAAAQIVRLQRQAATEPFNYHDKGTMATIGRRSAVVQLAQGLRLTGTLAWLAWLALHLLYLLGGRNRVSTLINLTYRYCRLGSRRRGDRRRRSRRRPGEPAIPVPAHGAADRRSLLRPPVVARSRLSSR